MTQPPPSPPPAAALVDAIRGFALSRAVYVAAVLGIADRLADGPKTADALAQDTDTDAMSLRRLLRALAGHGIFAQVDETHFGLTPMAELLRGDLPDSLRGTALQMGGTIYEAFAELEYSIRTGRSGYERHFGMPRFEHLARDPVASAAARAGQAASQAQAAAFLHRHYDFAAVSTLVDVGGAQGGLLAALLGEHPTMRGILFDTPGGLAGAEDVMRDAGVSDRVQIVSGDFFVGVPTGGDVYVLKNILRDWDDHQALEILRLCRAALPPKGRLLVIDPLMPPAGTLSPDAGADLVVRVLFDGGRDRTEAEFRALFADAGFAPIRVEKGGGLINLLEAAPV